MRILEKSRAIQERKVENKTEMSYSKCFIIPSGKSASHAVLIPATFNA
jgi:hypothetical protein